MALFKLPDSKDFFTELRTWLKTNKFIRLNDDGSQPELSKILAERGRGDQERKKRLRLLLEELAERAEVYAQGQHLKLNSNNIVSKFDGHASTSLKTPSPNWAICEYYSRSPNVNSTPFCTLTT